MNIRTLSLLFVIALICGNVIAGTRKSSIHDKPGSKKNITAPFDDCGGNCPSGDCPDGNCPCDIASICAQGNWDQTCCQCIVNHESGGNANAMNYNDNGSFDVGVFQINDVNWACNGGNAPCDPTANFKCAQIVYSNSGDWSPWSTCDGCGCCSNGGSASSSASSYMAGIMDDDKPFLAGGKGSVREKFAANDELLDFEF